VVIVVSRRLLLESMFGVFMGRHTFGEFGKLLAGLGVFRMGIRWLFGRCGCRRWLLGGRCWFQDVVSVFC
jgi:type IV secretory pathway VirB2 component (pilin)